MSVTWSMMPLPDTGEEFAIYVGVDAVEVMVVVDRRTAGVVVWPNDGSTEMMPILWVRRA